MTDDLPLFTPEFRDRLKRELEEYGGTVGKTTALRLIAQIESHRLERLGALLRHAGTCPECLGHCGMGGCMTCRKRQE